MPRSVGFASVRGRSVDEGPESLGRAHVPRNNEVSGRSPHLLRRLPKARSAAIVYGCQALAWLRAGMTRKRGPADDIQGRDAGNGGKSQFHVLFLRIVRLQSSCERGHIERITSDTPPYPRRRLVRRENPNSGGDFALAIACTSCSFPSMPRPRVTVRGASTSARPSPIENQPNPRAIECAYSVECISIVRFLAMGFALFMA